MPDTTPKRTPISSTGYPIVADLVRANFDLVMGSRTTLADDMHLAIAIVSHVLSGRTASWRHLKNFTRWYRQQYPGFGDWPYVLEFFSRKFPLEPEWSQALAKLKQDEAERNPHG